MPQTKIETDSYVAVQLLEQQGKLNLNSLKNMAESVQGSFCFTALDENNTLYIVKGSNPMCLLHFAELGLYVYASTENILKKALQKYGFHKYPFEVLHTVDPTSTTLIDWLRLWLETYMRNTLKQSTYVSYKGYIENHLAPAFPTLKLKDFTTKLLQDFYNYKLCWNTTSIATLVMP